MGNILTLIIIIGIISAIAQNPFMLAAIAVIVMIIYLSKEIKRRKNNSENEPPTCYSWFCIEHYADMDSMDGNEFEQFCADLLRNNGFKYVYVTPSSGDHGIDVIAHKDGMKYAVQCKCYSGNVGNHAVQEAFSGRTLYNANIAVVMTNSYFTKQAISDAQKLNVQLWNRDKIKWMMRTSGRYKNASKQKCDSKIKDNKVKYSRNIENIRIGDVRMYDREKGIYPAGQYLVGEDIDAGKYLLTSRKDVTGSVSIYNNYSDYRKDEPAEYESFDSDFHLSLRENGMFVVVANADMRRI